MDIFSIAKFFPRSPHAAGTSPGTVAYVGHERKKPVRIDLIDYTEADYEERKIDDVEELAAYLKADTTTWINVSGVHDTKLVERLGKLADLHPLTLEDITNTTRRPKIDEYDEYLYAVVKMAFYREKTGDLEIEQVSLILGKNFVISFQEDREDILDPLRERIRGGKGKIRRSGSSYLTYAIVDTVVDHYFAVLERFGEDIEELEERLMEDPTRTVLNDVYRMKRELIFIRRAVWPMRDVTSAFARNDYRLTTKETELYFRDVYDHVIQVADTIETFRDMASGMLDLYMSSVSNRLNEVMKVLTVFSTIFIPLTFVVGIYGMNFKFFPELEWRYGYAFVWGIMIAAILGMLAFFRRKKWM
jgi:magnesium transporter